MSQFGYTKKPEWNNDGLRPNHVSTNVFATPMGWMAPMPGMGGAAITGVTWLTNVATFTSPSHGLITGQDVLIHDVVPSVYNGYYSAVTVVDANTFTVPLTPTAFSPLTTPTAPTGTPSGTGGTVAAGTHYAAIVAVDGNGAKTFLGASSLGAVTTGATSSIAWAWTAVPNAISYEIWVGTVSGAENSFFTSNTNSFTQTLTAGTAGATPAQATPSAYVSGGVVGKRGEVIAAIGSLNVAYADLMVVPLFTGAVFAYSALAHMVTGDVASITLTASEAVDVSLLPYVVLNINTNARHMVYDAASSTPTSLVFKYTIVAGDVATAGQVTTGTTIVTNGSGTIRDVDGNHPQPFTPGIFVAPNTSAVSVN